MRFRLFALLVTVLAVSSFYSALAQEAIVKRSSVIENYKGKPYYIHFVNPGETLLAIAEVYHVTLEELRAENPSIDKGLKADMVLRIPQKPSAAVPETEVAKTEKQLKLTSPSEPPKVQLQPAGEQNVIVYKVKKQETLYGISKQFNVTVDEILKANPGFEGLKDGMEIKIPQKKTITKLVIPEVPVVKEEKSIADPDEIIVKTGETLYSIAKAHNTTVDALIDLNPTLSGGLKSGMVIRIRGAVRKNEILPALKIDTSTAIRLHVPGSCYNPENSKTTYQVALLLPFMLDDAEVTDVPEQKEQADNESFNYFQFYAGFMLAADSLANYGLHARIQVLDADRLTDTLAIRQALRKPGMDKLDMMVGPVYATSFAIAARFALKNNIGIINPLSRRESIVDRNPSVVKVQVSAAGASAKIADFIVRHGQGANVIAVRNDKKELKELADDFSILLKKGLADGSLTGTLQECVFSTDLMAGVSKKMKPGVKNIIVFFSNNKTIVPNFVSLLNPMARQDDILLMGMDGWDELELETEFLVNLNFHQLTSSYIDYESEACQQFITRFRNKYGAVPLPSKHAFLGYDMGWYFLTSLMWYGNDYTKCLPDHPGSGLQYNFDFAGAKTGAGLQNREIKMVKLQEYKMVKVD